VVWMNDLPLLPYSVSVQSRFEQCCFAASAQTMRQLSLQIESVYGRGSNLLSCLVGFVFDLYKAICGCTP